MLVQTVKRKLRSSSFTPLLIKAKSRFVSPKTQSDETAILKRLLTFYDVPNRFIEFGFSGWEFNCAPLVGKWEGLLVDGDKYNITIAENILPDNIKAEHTWLTLQTLDSIRAYGTEKPLGILSVDVDGNDYWFLEALIDLRPAIIIAEYNSSLGRRAVTVPYQEEFKRTQTVEMWPWYDSAINLYFGASLAALTGLAETHGYSLMDVTQTGINAFFVRNDLLHKDDHPLFADQVFRDQFFPDGSRPEERWNSLKHLPFVEVADAKRPC